MSDNIIGRLSGLFMLGLIGFIIYLALNAKNRFTTGFNGWKHRKTVHAVGTILRAAFFICVLVMAAIGGIQYYFTESGWYPRTREIVVFADAAKWVPGELRMCFSTDGSIKYELIALGCPTNNDKNTGESHALNVKFWGPITTERPKLWKCQREQTSLTCKLQ